MSVCYTLTSSCLLDISTQTPNRHVTSCPPLNSYFFPCNPDQSLPLAHPSEEDSNSFHPVAFTESFPLSPRAPNLISKKRHGLYLLYACIFRTSAYLSTSRAGARPKATTTSHSDYWDRPPAAPLPPPTACCLCEMHKCWITPQLCSRHPQRRPVPSG